MARYNGINESSVFKNPVKLPAIIHFTRCAEDVGEDQGADAPFGKTTSLIKEATEYQFTRNHMLQSSTDDEFKKAMRDFITEQTPKASSFFKQEKWKRLKQTDYLLILIILNYLINIQN